MSPAPVFDPRAPGVLADPYPVFRRLQAEDPVHWSEPLAAWVLTRHADVKSALTDPRLSSDRISPFLRREAVRAQPEIQELGRLVGRWAVFTDPPDHTRLRRQMNRAFTTRAVEHLRPRIEEVVDHLLGPVERRGEMDVIRDLAYPLPIIVIAEMLGVPVEDREQLKAWSDELALFVGSAVAGPAKYERAHRAVSEMTERFRGLVRQRRREPRGDLISELARAEEGGQGLTEDEVIATSVLLLFAGHETTTNLIGNGLIALLRHPEQLERLRREPALIGDAVEEILRYDAPTGAQVRVALEDVSLHGRTIRRGDRVFVMLNAANRDPARFEEPDRLWIGRPDAGHIAFGHGIHFCVGAPLARLEGEAAIGAIVRRLPELALAGEPLDWLPSLVFRGVRALPVRFVRSA